MYLQENTKFCLLHAISPVHAGSGAATGAVDLPIQREKHSNWPQIQASGVKGAFRDHCLRFWAHSSTALEPFADKVKQSEDAVKRIFGSDSGNGGGQAGAVAFSDARLLAFPVRSSAAPFVWVTCPALVKRGLRDLALVGRKTDNPVSSMVTGDNYLVLTDSAETISDDLVLEDICLSPAGKNEKLSRIFVELLPELERLILIPDHHFSFLVETATEIQAQIKIDPATGITATGSLRYEELLPAETIMYCLVFFGDEKVSGDDPLKMKNIADVVTAAVSNHIQMGGDLTLGRGIFSVNWWSPDNNGGAQ